ncbi:MAG: YgaP family membrane protein [Acidimicrobiales bacterium]
MTAPDAEVGTRPGEGDGDVGAGLPLPPLERGVIGIPKPQGWTIERLVSLLAGAAILFTLGLGRRRSERWRVLTGFVGVNLVLDGTVGWCPFSLLLHRLGILSAAERSRHSD